MTHSELFTLLLVTGVMWISAAVQFARKSYPLGALLVLIPLCGLIARVFGK